jgi:hypothetical protein
VPSEFETDFGFLVDLSGDPNRKLKLVIGRQVFFDFKFR